VIDSSASRYITPIPSDFIGKITTMDAPIQGLLATTKIKGIGTVRWFIVIQRVLQHLLKQLHISFLKQILDYSVQKPISMKISLDHLPWTQWHCVDLPNQLSLCFEYHKGNNLPMATTISSDMVAKVSMAFDAFTSQDVANSLVKEYNQNLTQAQTELLQWHWKLGHLLKSLNLLRLSMTISKINTTVTSTLIYSMTYNSSAFWSNRNKIPIVIDSSASRSITPILSDFIGKITTMDSPIQGLLATTKIKGIGTGRWFICDSRVTSTAIETTAYLIPEADIRLFSPQALFQ